MAFLSDDAEETIELRPREVNHGGLAQLYEILLESATMQIAAALRLVLKAAEADRTALLFCKVRRSAHGKHAS